MTAPPIAIGAAERARYAKEGYFVLEDAVAPAEVERLASACDRAVARTAAAMRARGAEVEWSSRLDDRYIILHELRHQPALAAFVFSDLCAAICRATVGDTAFFKADFFAVKEAGGQSFPWHQDAAQAQPLSRVPIVVVWVALDAMDEENGGLRLLPFERAPTRELVPPRGDGESTYQGADQGELLVMAPGSVVAYDGALFHASGPNKSPRARRAYVAGYSSAGDRESIPFLHAGERVERPAPAR
jgi:ectoine hydroxylase-related dioxygenase (phytanoyl-CoA dioxygenase family)